MRTQPSEDRNRRTRDFFEIEPERYCDLRLIYDVPADQVVIVLQPARRRQAARSVSAPLTMDFTDDGQMIGIHLTPFVDPETHRYAVDLARALRPFKACDNITADDHGGYIQIRPWDPYDDEAAYGMNAEAQFDLATDGGLIALRIARTTDEYELDPFISFYGLPWQAEVTNGNLLNQFGIF
ncbi:MAG: hypothetical protein U0641_17170 [Anaerolineae bacterium]